VRAGLDRVEPAVLSPYLRPGQGLTVLPDGRLVPREIGDAYMKAARMKPRDRDAGWLLDGVKGKAKHWLKLDQLPADEVRKRLAICRPCPKRGKDNVCGLCWCDLNEKARQRSEDCPAGLWPKPADQ